MRVVKLIVGFYSLLCAFSAMSDDYQVDGELISVANSRGAQQTFPVDSTPNFSGTWRIDKTAQTISGNLNFGDYEVRTEVNVFGKMVGNISLTGINHEFSGNGHWDPTTLTFKMSIPTGKPNSGIASNASGSGSCKGNGMVCGGFSNSTQDWEGLSITLVFSKDLATFSGTAKAEESSGSGFTKTHTTQTLHFKGQGKTAAGDAEVASATSLERLSSE